MNYPDICEGCLTYGIYKLSCEFAYVRDGKDALICPCSICLIKMVCVTACHLLKEHRDKIRLVHKMNGICKGCLFYERVGKNILPYGELTYSECPGYVFKDIDCPCQHCLIKMMCSSACDDLKKTKWFKD